MRIVIAGQTYLPGNNGQAIFTIHLAEGLAQAGHQVAVIVPSNGFNYRRETINQVDVHQIHSISFGQIHSGAFLNPLPDFKVRSILTEFKPDILHVQDHYFINFAGVRIARRMNIPVVGTNHFLPENLLPYTQWLALPHDFKINTLWLLMLWTYRQLDFITTPTETAARILAKQKLNVPIAPISCGVDTRWFSPAPQIDRRVLRQSFGLDPDRITFLYVGRQDREKRVDLLIQGLARLANSPRGAELCNKVQLAIAGQGAFSDEFRSLAQLLGVKDITHFLGYVPAQNLPDLYRVSDVFCMPSPEELQSIATLEAMASGKPVLAANARALPELVSVGVNGMLFDAGNPAAVEQGMLWMIDHADEWARMGLAGRSRAVAHSLQNTIHRYEELYMQVKEARRGAFNGAKTHKQPVTLK